MDDEFLLPSQRKRLAPPPEDTAPAAPTPSTVEPKFTLPSQVKRQPDYATMPWGEVAGKAATTFPSSAWNAAKTTASDIYGAVTHPVETAQGFGNLAVGAASKIDSALGVQQDPSENKEQNEFAINALMKHYGDKYGSRAAVAKVLAEDPASALADLSSVLTLTPTSAARIPGVLGTAAKTARTVGELGTPIVGPAKVVGAAAKAVSPLVNAPLAGISGVSTRSLQDAAKSGVTGSKAFWQAMSGEITPHQLVDDIHSAISQFAADRSQQYRQGMSGLSTTQLLPFQPIHDAITKIENTAYSGPGKAVKNAEAAEAISKIRDKVAQWETLAQTHPYYQTIHGFDDLKQAIDSIAKTYRGTPADRAVTDARKAVKSEIMKVDPQYADVMDQYAQLTDEIDEIRKELTVGKGTAGANLRKILNAQNNKYKAELINELARKDPDLPAKISGLEVAQAHGHSAGAAGFSGLLALMLQGAGMDALLPAIGAGAVGASFGSPKGAARTAWAVKQATRPFSGAGDVAGSVAPFIGAVRANEDVKREGRATGGRTGPKPQTAQSLIKAVERARKSVQQQTESILATPDEHVVKALSVANKHLEATQ